MAPQWPPLSLMVLMALLWTMRLWWYSELMGYWVGWRDAHRMEGEGGTYVLLFIKKCMIGMHGLATCW